MKNLTEGLTPVQFLTALNQNFIELAAIRSVFSYPTILESDNYVDLINSNYGSDEVSFGSKAHKFTTDLYNAFIVKSGGLINPDGLILTWFQDYVQIDFSGNSDVQHEIYESKNGGAYTLVTTLSAGVKTYNYQTWQNASLNYKVRAKSGSIYSGYSDVVNIATPLVFQIDESTLTPFVMQWLYASLGHNININFGDGTSQNIAGTNAQPASPMVTKNYTVPGQYWITITGDTDWITWLFSITRHASYYGSPVYGNFTKWVIPSHLEIMELFNVPASTTDITNWFPIPASVRSWNTENNLMTGNLDNPVWPSTVEIYLNGNHLTGSPLGSGIPGTATQISVDLRENNFTEDLTDIALPANLIRLQVDRNIGLSGDLSGQSIPSGTRYLIFSAESCSFTKGYRGSFKWVSYYNFKNNQFNSDEIDNLLYYIDSYFTSGVVPLTNCQFLLDGTGMGAPSSVGLAARTSILSKYAAAGKTCTISVNP